MNSSSPLKNLLFLFSGLFFALPAGAQIYVHAAAQGNNDGSSWEHAFVNLQDGLSVAKANDAVWVAAGTYLPGKSGDPKSTSFQLKKAVRLYGGFAGTETTLSDRDPDLYPSILSGDLNQDDTKDNFTDNRTDNVWTVLMIKNESPETPLIDGFIITGGHADGELDQGFEPRGGGVFSYGPIELRNCQLQQNYALLDGGALFSWDSLWVDRKEALAANSQVIIDSCRFSNNYSIRSGAGICNVMITSQVHSTRISNSIFLGNTTENDGGAIELYTENADSKISIENCLFENNRAEIGGAIYDTEVSANIELNIQDCIFKDNSVTRMAGAVYTQTRRSSSNVKLEINDCTFTNNSTANTSGDWEGGGAVYIVPVGSRGSFNIQNSFFEKNSSQGWGGAIAIVTGSLQALDNRINIDSCHFENHYSDCGGAIMYMSKATNDSLFITHSQFIENTVEDIFGLFATKGGAIHLDYVFVGGNAYSRIEDCVFENNKNKEGSGGAIYVTPTRKGSFSSIYNCTFSGNEASDKGGAFYYAGIDKAYEIEACTFEKNSAGATGNHIFETPTFDSSLFYIFFHGVLWVQIFYSLLLFLISRERSTLYYTVLMIGTSLFFLSIIDFFNVPFINSIPLYARLIIVQFSVLLIMLGLLKFAQQYLRVNHYFPRAKKWVNYLILAVLIIQIVNYLLSNGELVQYQFTWAVYIGMFGQFLLFIGLLTPIIWAILIARRGFKPARYFLLAMLFTGIAIALTLFYFIRDTHWLDAPMILIQSLILLTVIVLGLADGFRVNLLKKDKERAERLTELDIAKTRLYNNITHEFRTPLTVIMGSAEMIRGNEQEKQLIGRNSKQLLQLINQMLDLSKLEGGALKLSPIQHDIIPFLEYLVESYQSLADSKYIQLTFYREIEALMMDYDPEKMQMIIVNLVSNAIKFTPESGKVVVHAKKEQIKNKDYLVLSVRDNGHGIPEKDLPHIFDRFYQVDDSDIRRSEGSGIGLALVRELVDLMEGEITVNSKQDRGTVFTISLPVRNNAEMQTAATLPNSDLIIQGFTPQKQAPAFLPEDDDLPLALIIEDNRDVVHFLKSCLKQNYRLEIAFNGREGIEKALEIIPDIIISDVMMPEADGYTVCKTLKADERTSHVPIIILTAKATQEDKVRGLDVGADAYLNKPFHREELDVRLRKLIALRRALQKRYQGNLLSDGSSANKEDDFIRKLRVIVSENMENESFGIADLCRAVGLSRMQVHRKLKALTGMPTTSFIHLVRLQHAYKLLSTTDLNVSEVAYKVGFSDHSYFTKLFVRQFGKTPSEISRIK